MFACFGNAKKKCGHDEDDNCQCNCDDRKPLDVNKYATKKTIAQGMLDIALLSANASQLKYILQVGRQHEFYTLMLGLITTSLILQVLVGILLLSLNFMRDCRLHLLEYKTSATYINYVTTALSIAITAINLLISAFDPSLARFASSIDLNNNGLLPRLDFLGDRREEWATMYNRTVIVGILFLVIGSLDIKKSHEQRASLILNDVILLLVFVISLVNVVISSFGMEYTNNEMRLLSGKRDPAVQFPVAQAVAGAYLGTAFNINKEHHHISANFLNNIILCSNVIVVALNTIISTFNIGGDTIISLVA